jgi:D-sedoheptulose 7-phosphate isomerase
MTSRLETELAEHVFAVQRTVLHRASLIGEIADCFTDCFQRGNKLLICGNGGSAADAQHVAAEFVNRFRFDRSALPAIALTTDTSILTSIGNDYTFERIFSRQVEALGQKGDVLVGISTSGRSASVLRALRAARERGLTTVGFTGAKGRRIMASLCDHCLSIPSTDTARIQECHEFIWHVICGMVEQRVFAKEHRGRPRPSGRRQKK